MSNSVSVSVVIPVYKVEKYLADCIESVIGQTYKNVEIILVDDGSPDNCPAICDEYAGKDGRIKVIHKENQGLGEARNTGIDNATGDYIFFVDGDDYVKKDMIESCVSLAEKHGADVVHYGFEFVSEDNVTYKKQAPKGKKEYYFGEEIKNVVIPSLIDNGNFSDKISGMIFSFSAMMIASALLKNGFKCASEREIISEDFYSILDFYYDVKSAAIITKPFYVYRKNPSSLSHTFREDRLEKNNEFYKKCSSFLICKGYGEKIADGISRMYLGNTIEFAKQLNSKKDEKYLRDTLNRISKDEVFIKAYEKHDKNSFPFFGRMFLRFLFQGKIGLCRLMLKVKGNK